MKYQILISQSKLNLEMNPLKIDKIDIFNIFESGAKWMFIKLNEDHGNSENKFNLEIHFLAYGILKYAISLIIFFLSAFCFLRINLFLIPLSIIIFYLVEVHFLFLFPILIDNYRRPVWTSIKQTYKTGLLTTLITTIPIGLYMVIGLLNLKNPFRNWYIGCLAVIIWYKNEIRNRI